tara:strand:+ start:678 stop:1238 length:561 start_codon:yes stop_codon:yes gene_type:complete
MIKSISRALQHGDAGEETSPPAAASQGLTRSNFLRAMAAGVMTAGVAMAAKNAYAATSSGIEPVTDIDKLYDVWQSRFNAADLEGLVDLYVSDVTYINPDGKLMTGKSCVREDFAGLLALKPQIILGDREHHLYHDIALTTNHWKLAFTDEAGVKQELTGGGIEVMRKQSDGGWRYIIDDASRSAV